jgi:hypothetical protein
MNCTKCGEQVLETARFCPACGTPVGGADASKVQSRGRLIAMLGGALAVVIIAAAALFYAKRPQPSVAPAVAPQAQAPGGDAAKTTPAQIAGFDWSGLSPEQLQAARAALDAAIAKEEQGRLGKSNAAHADGKSVP